MNIEKISGIRMDAIMSRFSRSSEESPVTVATNQMTGDVCRTHVGDEKGRNNMHLVVLVGLCVK